MHVPMSPTAGWNNTACVAGYLYKCRFIFWYRWFTQTQANKLKDLCFAPFHRYLLWTHKGKCHWATPHHVRDGIKESEFMTPISKRHKLNKKGQVSDMSSSLYVGEPGHCLFNHICSVFLVVSVLGPSRGQPTHTRAGWGSMEKHFTPIFHQLPQGWGWKERSPLGFCTAPVVESVLCQGNKTPGCAYIAEMNRLTPTMMRHFCVSQSLAGGCLLWIREDFGVKKKKKQKQTRSTCNWRRLTNACIDGLCPDLTDSQQDELLNTASGKSLSLPLRKLNWYYAMFISGSYHDGMERNGGLWSA